MFIGPDELQMVMRLVLSCLLGALIGLERESGDRPAGFRTHILVCTGSCLFMLVSIYGFDGTGAGRDPARLAAQVVTGVGFLGAGTIMHAGVTVKGLTTAATIWMISAIGLTVGAGLYFVGVFATLLMLCTLVVFGRWGKLVNVARRSERYLVKINAKDQTGNAERLAAYFKMDGTKVRSINVMRNMVKETFTINVNILVNKERLDEFHKTLLTIKDLEYVIGVENLVQLK